MFNFLSQILGSGKANSIPVLFSQPENTDISIKYVVPEEEVDNFLDKHPHLIDKKKSIVEKAG
jgi:hypothetical protein